MNTATKYKAAKNGIKANALRVLAVAACLGLVTSQSMAQASNAGAGRSPQDAAQSSPAPVPIGLPAAAPQALPTAPTLRAQGPSAQATQAARAMRTPVAPCSAVANGAPSGTTDASRCN